MKIAVTGASGHIGNTLVRELKKKGTDVKVLVHSFANDLEQLGAELVYGDVLDIDSLRELCKGVEVVFHLAARIAIDNRHADLTHKVNVGGTKNMLEAAKEAGVKKFIHFSSIHAFQVHPLEETLDETRPLNETDEIVYEYTKALSEKLIQKATEEGMHTVIINPTAVIGPFDFRKSFLGQALRMIYKNSLPMLVNGGYNWVDVRDVVTGAIKAMETAPGGEKYILSGHYCSLKELSGLIGKVSGSRTPQMVAPVLLARIACPFMGAYAKLTKGQPLYTKQSLYILENSPKNISNKKAQTDLNYIPRGLTETLTDTFNWYSENGLL